MAIIHPVRILFPNMDLVTSGEVFFAEVKEHFPAFRDHGFFLDSERPVLCIYRASNQHEQHLGIFGAIAMDDVDSGKVIGHESTLAEKEQIMLQLIMERNALIKPVLLTYPDQGRLVNELQQIIDQRDCSFSFSLNDFEHAVWVIEDLSLLSKVQSALDSEASKYYIADGHHRTSTTDIIRKRFRKLYHDQPHKLEPYNFLFCAVFPMSQLDIHDFNRKVSGLNGLSDIAFMALLSSICNIERLDIPRKPLHQHEITMFLKDEWFSLVWKEEIIRQQSQAADKLDVSLLNNYVLHNILGISDVRSDKRVTYVEGPAGIEVLETPVDFAETTVSFCLYPVNFSQFIEISDSSQILPPKSTWFVPRIHNGLVVMPYTD